MRLEERSYCCQCFTHLLNELAGKIRGDSVHPTQVHAASLFHLISINIVHYSNELNGMLSYSEIRVEVLFQTTPKDENFCWFFSFQWRLTECLLCKGVLGCQVFTRGLFKNQLGLTMTSILTWEIYTWLIYEFVRQKNFSFCNKCGNYPSSRPRTCRLHAENCIIML